MEDDGIRRGLGERLKMSYNWGMDMQTKPRRKKFVRVALEPFRLQPRDIAILRDVAEFRFLSSLQILALHHGGKRNLLRRLSALFEHGYLDRPKQQTSARLSSSHFVYSLGREGAKKLIADTGERERMFRRLKDNERTLPLIAHSLMISKFRVCLLLALAKQSDIKLTRWLQGDDLKQALKRSGEHPPLVADAYFVLETATHSYPCFLEADRATMTEERYTNKLRMYWKQSREESFAKSLGIKFFRVLTITPNERRAENLRLAAKGADDRKEGSRLFLFLTETRYSEEKPDAILGNEWKSPKDDEPCAII